MDLRPPDAQILAALRREIALTCDDSGRIGWADDAALQVLGVRLGTRLTDYAAPTDVPKVALMLERLRSQPVYSSDLTLTVNGEAAPVLMRGTRAGDHIVLVGHILQDSYTTASVPEVRGAMRELSVLQRETERQQRELLRRNEQLIRLNRELEDSNRGMVALHAEVEENRDSIRRINEVKSRVVSNVTHEFRTPLNSIIGLSQILLARSDGDLTPEQEKQVSFIRTCGCARCRRIEVVRALGQVGELAHLRMQVKPVQPEELQALLVGAPPRRRRQATQA